MIDRNAKDNSTSRALSARHDVQFYQDDLALTACVADFLAEGIRAGQPCIAITTPVHRRAFTAYLKTLGIDAASLDAKQLLWLDAHETLASFMEGNHPNVPLFHAMANTMLEELIGARRYVTVRAFGEMVDVLWRDGKPEAAFQLEELWNEIANAYSLALLCSYHHGGMMNERDIARIARLHTTIVTS